MTTEDCTYELEYDACPADARLWRERAGNPGFESRSRRLLLRLEEAPVEGEWQGVHVGAAEPGVWVVSLDVEGTIEEVRVWADPDPVDALLAPGEPVRLSLHDLGPSERAVLRLERVSDDALLMALVRFGDGWAAGLETLPLEGLGAGWGDSSPCDELGYVSAECPAVPVRGYAFQVGDTEIELSRTRRVTTPTGTFRVTNLTIYGPSVGSRMSCPASCAIAVGPDVQLDIVRVE